MKKIRVITQGSVLVMEIRKYFFFWLPIAHYRFDPEAFGSHGETLELAFREADTMAKSLKEKRKEEIRI